MNKQWYKSMFCFLTAASLSMPLFSCGTSETSETTPQNESESAATVETKAAAELPTIDMDGFTLRIANEDPNNLSWAYIDILVEQNGTAVNDAIFRRNIEIQETYQCVLECSIPGDGYIQNMVTAGIDEYDICMLYDVDAINSITCMQDWNELSYLELDHAWWNPDATDMFDINGKQYFTAGNMTLGYLSRAMCYLVNWNLYDRLGLTEDLYGMVNAGKWTQDAFLSLAVKGIQDTDGDGVYTVSDTYGAFGNPRAFLYTFMGGANVKFVERDDDGKFMFRLAKNEIGVNLINNLVQFVVSNPNLYYNEGVTVYDSIPSTLFTTGQALFHVQGLPHTIAQLREMEDSFGILPLPKLTEEQSKYCAPAYGAVLGGLPKSVDTDRYEYIGLLAEALTRRSQELVVPEYKEVLLKDKLIRDEASADMLDIIFNNITFEPGIVLWCNSIADPICQDIFVARSDAIVSYLEENTVNFQAAIDQLNDAVS